MTIAICRNLTKLYGDVIESNILDKRSKDNKNNSENEVVDILIYRQTKQKSLMILKKALLT
jgi:hypothetical protein